MSLNLPVSDLDPFCDELLAEPYEYYRAIRDAGSVVYIEKYDVVALSRFEDVRSALRDWRTFTSTEGVAFNDALNQDVTETVLCMEPPVHNAVRAAMTQRLKLSEIREVAPLARHKAEEMVDLLVERRTFDGVKDLAEPYVMGIVGDLLGIPDSLLDLFVAGGEAGFMMVGPMNERSRAAMPVLQQLFEMMGKLTKIDMKPGSLAWNIFEAAERGEIPEAMQTRLLWNFTGAAFDTTISGLGNMLWLLAAHQDQWEMLRADPSLATATVNEGLRLESPIQIWSRVCREEAIVDGVAVPMGKRVAIMLGAANRDERHYPDPDVFQIRRNPLDHLGFGHGIHVCVGAPLARLELTSVLSAIATRVQSFKLDGNPVRKLSNVIRGLESLPLAVA